MKAKKRTMHWTVDFAEAFKKLTAHQGGKDPYDYLLEFVANALDAYGTTVPIDNRIVDISAKTKIVSITDYAENGMTWENLEYMLSLGGTNKDGCSTIGRFGIGMWKVWKPSLGLKCETIISKLDGEVFQIQLQWKEVDGIPNVTYEFLDGVTIDYTTRVELEFSNDHSVDRALQYARKTLQYYHAVIRINGETMSSIWEEAKDHCHFFADGAINGFIEPESGWNDQGVTILRQYEKIFPVDLGNLAATSPSFWGYNHHAHGDLRDYSYQDIPYIPQIQITVNVNDLDVTIARNSFRLDSAYGHMIRTISTAMKLYLESRLSANSLDRHTILANIYILRDLLRKFLAEPSPDTDNDRIMTALNQLANTPIFQLHGKSERVSLVELKDMKSEHLPLFFSRTGRSPFGPQFEHDCIVLAETCRVGNGAPAFWDSMLGSLFGDVVNLDTIQGNPTKLADLVKRGIISKEALSPKPKIVTRRDLNEKESLLLTELMEILSNENVLEVVRENIFISTASIQPVFFDIDDKSITIATGLFDEEGRPVSDDEEVLNLSEKGGTDSKEAVNIQRLLLGIRRAHPLIEQIMEQSDALRAYYLLSYLAGQLVHCQKRLVPYSYCYQVVRDNLAKDMRKALISRLISI